MSRSFAPRLTPFVVLVVVSLLSPSGAMAADSVAGKWQGTMETQRGANEITMEFTGSDDALEGTWTGPRGTEELENVAYENDVLTFVRNVDFQGNTFQLDFKATIDGDEMDVTMTTPRGQNQFNATRVK